MVRGEVGRGGGREEEGGRGGGGGGLEPQQLAAEGPEAGARLWSLDLDAVLAGIESPILVGWSFGSGVIQSWLYAHEGCGDAAAVVLAGAPNVIGPVPTVTWQRASYP